MNSLKELIGTSRRFAQNRTALICPGHGQLSYTELWERVAFFSSALTSAGLGKGQLIGHCLPKTDTSVVALCAILDIEAAYTPVDAGSPVARNAGIFADCFVSAILVSPELTAEYVQNLNCEVEIMSFEQFGCNLLKCTWTATPGLEYADNLAMVLYTSGSSGAPKGVQITHGNALAFVHWCSGYLNPEAPLICASIAPFHFDLSVFDLYVSLLHGSAILLLDQSTCQNPRLLALYLSQYEVSLCYTTPTLLKTLLHHGQLHKRDFSSLQRVIFAGEVFPVEALRSLKNEWPHARFVNFYGPTETNVVSFYEIPKAIEPGRVSAFPIGFSCDFARCMIATGGDYLDPAPALKGELLVSGPSVTPGYLGHTATHSSEHFVYIADRRFYRTGDMVRVLDDGSMEFLGRKDRTVKRRGYRIALEEIEQTLSLHPEAAEVAVSYSSTNEQPRILAFFVTKGNQTALTPNDVLRFCAHTLPSYFLPDRVVLKAALPKTTTGKIDYARLDPQ